MQSIDILRTLERATAVLSARAGPSEKTRFLGMDVTPRKKTVLRISPVSFLYAGANHMHDLFCIDSVWYVNFPAYSSRDICDNYWFTLNVNNTELLQAITDGGITFTFKSIRDAERVFTFGKSNQFSATSTLGARPRVLLPRNGEHGMEYDEGSINFIQRTAEKTVAEAWTEYFTRAA
jgi:hypothetical protein